jgi:hypothetical protein
VGDDWRVELDVAEHGGLQHLLDGVREHKVTRAARDRLGDRMKVTVDDDRLFVYTETEPQAHEAERVLRELAADRALEVRATVARWHPVAQRWEPLGDALPTTTAERGAERKVRDAQQEAEAAQRGYAEWEVRVELPDHEAAAALGERLELEGMSVVCRSRYVVLAAANQDEAGALADRIREEAPGALSVTAEGSAAVAMDELNPFTVVAGRWRRT